MNISKSNIDALLRREDIEGLIELGAPGDEYDSEAGQIASALVALPADQFNIEGITAILALSWMRNFNLTETEIALRMPAIRTLADKIAKA